MEPYIFPVIPTFLTKKITTEINEFQYTDKFQKLFQNIDATVDHWSKISGRKVVHRWNKKNHIHDSKTLRI